MIKIWGASIACKTKKMRAGKEEVRVMVVSEPSQPTSSSLSQG